MFKEIGGSGMIDPIANKNNLHCDDCLYCQPYCNGKGERIYALCLRFPPNSTGGFSKTNGQICGEFKHIEAEVAE